MRGGSGMKFLVAIAATVEVEEYHVGAALTNVAEKLDLPGVVRSLSVTVAEERAPLIQVNDVAGRGGP